MIRLLAVSGSLRAGSSNTLLLEAVARLAPPDVLVTPWSRLAGLPAFSPDLDVEPPPPAVADWRAALAGADGVVLSSPEYAHGVPGALKNALDWVVGSGELYGRPVALLNPSPMSAHAHPQLAETLRVMTANVVEDASITLPVTGRGLDAPGIAAEPALALALRAALDALLAAVAAGRTAAA